MVACYLGHTNTHTHRHTAQLHTKLWLFMTFPLCPYIFQHYTWAPPPLSEPLLPLIHNPPCARAPQILSPASVCPCLALSDRGGKGEEKKGGQRDYFPLFLVTTQASSGDPTSDPFRLCETVGSQRETLLNALKCVCVCVCVLNSLHVDVCAFVREWTICGFHQGRWDPAESTVRCWDPGHQSQSPLG